jgi:hypothetical protein
MINKEGVVQILFYIINILNIVGTIYDI